MSVDPTRSAGSAPVSLASLDRDRRRRLLAGASGALLLVVPVLGALLIAGGHPLVGAIALGSQLPNLLGWTLLRRGKAVDLVGWTLLSLVFAAAAAGVVGTGGLQSAFTPWLVVMPLLAAHAYGARGGAVFGGLALACVVGAISWEAFRGPIPESLGPGPGPILRGFSLLGALALLVAATISSHRAVRRTDRARRDSELGFRDALQELPDGFLVYEPSSGRRCGFHEVYRNPAAEAMLSELEAGGRDLFDLQAGLRGPRLRLDFARLAMDGNKLAVSGLGHPELEQLFELTATRWHGALLVCLHESTRRDRMQTELARARQVAADSSKAKSDFLASMSREIRTPMNGVLGMARLAQDGVQDPETEEYLATIHACADSLLHLLDDLLDLSQIEAGKLVLERTRFDLQEVIDSTLEALAPRAAEQGVRWNAWRQPEVPLWFHGDPTRLRQVLLNLAGNGIRSTLEGGVELELSALSVDEERARIRFEVRDTGVGIPAEEIPRLFERFTSSEDSSPAQFGGAGIGLAISAQLVERMGGWIQVESVVDEGSRFCFELEFERAPAPPGATAPHEGLAGRRVLVLEAEPIEARVLCQQLRELGCRYEQAAEPAEAAALIRAALAEDDDLDALVGEAPTLLDPELAALREDPACRRLHWIRRRPLGDRRADGLDEVVAATLRRPARPAALRAALLAAFGLPEVQGGAAGSEQPAADTETGAGGRARSASALAPNGRVLVASADPVQRKLILRALERRGLEAESAEASPAALRTIRGGDFALVLVECQLPELDGFELARRIRGLEGRGGRVPLVALTAAADRAEEARCLQAGMDACLASPLDLEQLDQVLHRFLSAPSTGQAASPRRS